jgi:hypothetical protein
VVHQPQSTQRGNDHFPLSIMKEKLAQAGEGGGGDARPPPFTMSTVASLTKLCYATAERACRYTPPISTLPLYVLYGTSPRSRRHPGH